MSENDPHSRMSPWLHSNKESNWDSLWQRGERDAPPDCLGYSEREAFWSMSSRAQGHFCFVCYCTPALRKCLVCRRCSLNVFNQIKYWSLIIPIHNVINVKTFLKVIPSFIFKWIIFHIKRIKNCFKIFNLW